MSNMSLQSSVVRAGIELVKAGLIARTWGNVSCRIDEESFWITPSGRDYLTLKPSEIVKVSIKDLSYTGSIKPSSEKGIHAAVYERFSDVNFVIHTHQASASVVSALGLDRITLSEDHPLFSNQIICAAYALPGTQRLKRHVVEALEKTEGSAIILKHHGAVCFGRDYESAFNSAYSLEQVCSDFIQERKSAMTGDAHHEEQHQNQHQKQPLKQQQKASQQKQADSMHLIEMVKETKGGCVLLNQEEDIVRYACQKNALKPFLDDFAQIIGIEVKVVKAEETAVLKALKNASAVFIENLGALCWGKDESEAKAVQMVLNKNCKAYFGAVLFEHIKPINLVESLLMRWVYLKKYSKLSGGKI
ncbi:class II aldolase/adducin family protein [Fusibacter ferrireducens]|uniref:Class II aldolase/adducin family protein n=1 Tax=Fusibacter ferrireducens TaxID=2785058 RepID=A0ABR9ZNQ8_9FIRM|nr:class II aldolase/adducin family protein [Fusibacter ferrireducens]MBF4691621.1 class II aldolase/adducin family protein [Fusibacter ferrireducens]